jgi:CubicO group peptidase (beta-lactamase class C family)
MNYAKQFRLGGTRLPRRELVGRAASLAAPAALAAVGLPAGRVMAAGQPGMDTAMKPAMAMSDDAFSPTRLERMHEVMAGYVARDILPGLVTVVSRHGEVVAETYGVTAFDGSEPMQRDTIFRIASVSKPITAAAAMILVEECTLRLDDPVDAFLPELANRQVLRTLASPLDDTVPAKRPINLRDLLTFRLGYGIVFAPPGTYPIQQAMEDAGVIPDVYGGGVLPTLTPDESMQGYGSLPLLHQPGEGWLYNSGADILGVLIARASGMSFGDFLQQRLFEPLGMKDSGFSVPADKLDRLVTAYWTNFATGELEVFDGVKDGHFAQPPAFESGGGGLASTADDLLAFGEMMLNNGQYRDQRILSRPSVEAMTTDQLTPEQKAASIFFPGIWDNRGWGFGVSVITKRDALENTPGRYGWDGGWGTSWYVDPTEGLIGILLTQRSWDADGMPTFYSDFWTSAYQAIEG